MRPAPSPVSTERAEQLKQVIEIYWLENVVSPHVLDQMSEEEK